MSRHDGAHARARVCFGLQLGEGAGRPAGRRRPYRRHGHLAPRDGSMISEAMIALESCYFRCRIRVWNGNDLARRSSQAARAPRSAHAHGRAAARGRKSGV